ncbi:transglutaminase domain-containing protein [Paenibacillus sepulcri]
MNSPYGKRGSTFILLLGLGLMMFLWRGDAASAAGDSAATIQDYEKKLGAAMLRKPAAYSIVYTGGTLTMDQLESILQRIHNANDYLHYSTRQYRYAASTDGRKTTVGYTFEYWETQAQSNQVSLKVKEVLGKIITRNMNDFQKEKAIHDWIESNLSYDTTLRQYSAYAGLFGNKKTVCQGYALLAFKMLSQAGIENKIIEGNAGGQLHTWNLVKLDGKWYHLDTTWNDPVPDKPGRIMYDYYNLTDAQMKASHTWNKSASYPAAVTLFETTLEAKRKSDAGNAAFYQNLKKTLGLHYMEAAHTAVNAADLSGFIANAIKANQNSFTIRYPNKRTLAADIKKAFNGTNNISRYSYSYSDYTRSPSSADVLVTVTLTRRK